MAWLTKYRHSVDWKIVKKVLIAVHAPLLDIGGATCYNTIEGKNKELNFLIYRISLFIGLISDKANKKSGKREKIASSNPLYFPVKTKRRIRCMYSPVYVFGYVLKIYFSSFMIFFLFVNNPRNGRYTKRTGISHLWR